ncbi:sigma 54-interacting transcriptional regulator [Clostridioides difficile]|nr:sigma 54-interacting transcriptional regulator [Clostridioides difficile]
MEIANGGILFLDEIHRLPAEGQEMLFTFIDKEHLKD